MIIAHRGYYSEFIPENSMEAFRKCLVRGINIELDVRLTKDNKIVVFHDRNMFRMTKIDKNIELLTYDEIVKYHLKKSKEKVPLLEDVLRVIDSKVFLLIELKNSKVGLLEDKIIELLKNYRNFALQTFNYKSAMYLKRKSSYKIGIISFKYKKKLDKFDFITLPLFSALKTNKELYIFNIDNKKELEIAKKYGDNYIVKIKEIIKK